MKHLRLVSSLALIPLCAFLGSFIAIGSGNAILIGIIVGIALSYLVLTYAPIYSKDKYPKSYYLKQHQLSDKLNDEIMLEEIRLQRKWSRF